ncbi:MAG TPA: solute carrier family 23 protein [Stellaceae bacterium]|jgi:uracil-xanthine permease|nr:solute carrier family 23 protein [Stellaceae bacterium]
MLSWTLNEGRGVIAPDERLPIGQTIVAGLQHAIVMFGAAVLCPLLMGFDANVAIFFSGIGTLIFFVCVGGRVPSYLGSSFSFIAVVIAVTAYTGHGPNPNISVALGGIIAAGALYAVIGLVVIAVGYAWVERLMPPAVTGAIVAVIGLNLAPVAIKEATGSALDTWVAVVTVIAVGMIAASSGGLLRRVPVLLGGLLGYILYVVLTNGLGWGKPVDFALLVSTAWLGWPHFTAPQFDAHAMTLIAPVAIVLVAENLGHIKAVSAMTGRNLDRYLGRAFLGDGIATMVAGSGGGTGVTTYAENIGVMAVTGIYSTLIFPVAAVVAIVLGLSPKFGALIQTIPTPVIGGLSLVVFGLIAATAGRIWVEARVNFSDPRNLVTVAVTLIAGSGDMTLHFGEFNLTGIGTATLCAIVLYQLLGWRRAAA